MIDDIERQSETEKERMKYTILAGNPQLWQTLYGADEQEDEKDVEWITPKSAEDVDDMLNILKLAEQHGSESFNEDPIEQL